MEASFAVGRHVTKIYGPDPGPSLVLTCLESGKPVSGYICVYRTAHGKLVNSSHHIYPFFDQGKVTGCLCFIQGLSTIEVCPSNVSNINDLATTKLKSMCFDKIIGCNINMQKAIAIAYSASQTPSPILIYGETGTGKEMFAASIHQASKRKQKHFVAINCAAIPESLLEGILFGTTKGVFTGAVEKKGLLEEANEGTLFLDEIDSMPLLLQPKLLRVLQDKKVRRLGGNTEILVDIKIISASSVSPLLAVEHGKLRADLFYRLGVVLLKIPPLRERIDDLEDLLVFFILKYNTLLGKKVVQFSREVIKMLRVYDWPGNIRELEHLVEGTLNLAGNKKEVGIDLLPDHFRERIQSMGHAHPKLEKMGKQQVVSVNSNHDVYSNSEGVDIILEAMSSSFGNTTLAAKLLGISRQLLSYRLKKYGIDKRAYKI